MAKNSNDKRIERRERSERNMNRAVILLIAGLVAEWYLLMVDRYYARGTIEQMLNWYDALGLLRWCGLAALAAGIALFVLRGKQTWFDALGRVLMGIGGFFAFTSICMRHYYPVSVTVMCVLVPVLLILGIVYLFYQAEFSVQATALAMALGAIVLLGRSSSTSVKLCAALSLLGVAALAVGTMLLKKNGGVFKTGDKLLRLFPANMDYRLTLGVLGLCFVLTLVVLFASAVSFYAVWALAIVAFVLAVYYTIKLM